MYWWTARTGSLFVSHHLHLCGNSQHSSQYWVSLCIFSSSKEGKWIRNLPLQSITVRPAVCIHSPSVDWLHLESRQLDFLSCLVQRDCFLHVHELLQQHSFPHLHCCGSVLSSCLPYEVFFPKDQKVCIRGQPIHLGIGNCLQCCHSVGRWDSHRIL